MSEYETLDAHHHEPKFEPWLGMMLASFIPAVLTVFVPDAAIAPLVVVTVLLLSVAFAMLTRQIRRTREEGRLGDRPAS